MANTVTVFQPRRVNCNATTTRKTCCTVRRAIPDLIYWSSRRQKSVNRFPNVHASYSATVIRSVAQSINFPRNEKQSNVIHWIILIIFIKHLACKH
jgi:hypothetical protein